MNLTSFRVSILATLSLATLAATGGAAEPAREKPAPIASIRRLEFVEMLSAILNDEPMDAGHAWFHPAQSRYGWKWLADRMDANHDGAITPDEFTGPKELFERLDRDRDGRLTAEDFDWSDDSPYWRQQGMARQLLRRGDADHDGKLSAEEWQSLFKQAAKGKDQLTPDDLRVLLFPPQPKPPGGPPSGMPSKMTLLLGLLNSELGSPSEGPVVGRPAPDFTLPGPDGKEISLHAYRGDRPLVLVFGSFT
jgi:Ca2+-binding EF-hand superfamily protein